MPFRSSASTATPAASLVVTKPAGTVSGDVLIAWALSDSATTTFTWPSGFVAVTGTPLVSTADAQSLGCAIKIAGGSEPTTYTLTGSDAIIGGVGAWSGDGATQPQQSSAVASSVANATPISIVSAAFSGNTTTVCDLVLIVAADTKSSTDETFTAPGGFTTPDDLNSGFLNGALMYSDAQASGFNGVATATGSNGSGAQSGWGAFMLALAAASVADTLWAASCL